MVFFTSILSLPNLRFSALCLIFFLNVKKIMGIIIDKEREEERTNGKNRYVCNLIFNCAYQI